MGSEKAHETGLAGRYANAVFELARDANAVDAVGQDFTALTAMIDASPELARVVKSPLFTHQDQARAMTAILAKMGAQKITTQFVLTLAQKRRLAALEAIIASFNRLVARMKGEVEAEVTSARALTESETADLKAMLKNKLGATPRLETRVDPTLLGGLVVKLGSRMIDTSIRTKLNGLAAVMKGH